MACTTCGGQSIVKTAKNIVIGTVNAVFESDEIKALAEPRLAKCKVCPHAEVIARLGKVEVLQCKLCKCLCALKARVEEEHCPIELW